MGCQLKISVYAILKISVYAICGNFIRYPPSRPGASAHGLPFLSDFGDVAVFLLAPLPQVGHDDAGGNALDNLIQASYLLDNTPFKVFTSGSACTISAEAMPNFNGQRAQLARSKCTIWPGVFSCFRATEKTLYPNTY